MVTKVITDYLDDSNISLKQKFEYIKRLDLPYSDIFELMELYKWDYDISHMLSPFVSYQDSKANNKIRRNCKENIELRKKNRKKTKNLRSRKKYD